MTLKIYHNPRCRKSREALELLNKKGLKPEVIEYLKTPPSPRELDGILKKLHMEPQEIVRTKEEVYQDLHLSKKQMDRKDWIQVLVKNPILIERPIVVHGGKAALGRPPEKVLEVL